MNPIRRDIRALTRLALPVVGSQLASMMLWVVDLLMVGPLGVEALDAASLGRTWIMATVVFGMGVVLGIDPIVSQGRGARDRERQGLALQWGLVLAVAASVPLGILWGLTGPVLEAFGQEPHLAREAHGYVQVQIAGLPFFLGFFALRGWLQGRGIMRPTLVVTLLANGVNAGANWVLIYGNLGFPRMGLLGAGVATLLTEIFMLAALAALVWRWRLARGGWSGWNRRALNARDLGRTLAFGLPVAAQLGLEFWAFVLGTFIAGVLGHAELAAYTVVINVSSVTFMVPLGLSIAAATRVGNRIGAGDPAGARRAAWVAFGLGTLMSMVFAAAFLLGRRWIPSLYTDDLEVIALCAATLPIAAAFQLFDAVQVVGGGILRGMGRVLPAVVFNLVGYYVLALPFGWWLAMHQGVGLAGLWWALCLGLGAVAVLVVGWVWFRGPR